MGLTWLRSPQARCTGLRAGRIGLSLAWDVARVAVSCMRCRNEHLNSYRVEHVSHLAKKPLSALCGSPVPPHQSPPNIVLSPQHQNQLLRGVYAIMILTISLPHNKITLINLSFFLWVSITSLASHTSRLTPIAFIVFSRPMYHYL